MLVVDPIDSKQLLRVEAHTCAASGKLLSSDAASSVDYSLAVGLKRDGICSGSELANSVHNPRVAQVQVRGTGNGC